MQRTRRELLWLVGAGSLGIAGCTGSSGTASSPTGTDAGGMPSSPTGANGDESAATVVEMVGVSFDPVRASVDAGGTVEWVNRDGFSHDVTAAQFTDGAADWQFSTTLAGGERARHTFESAGVYEYYCSIHGRDRMCGAVIVGDAALDASLPCESGDDSDGGTY
ncbi:MAG: plastocyanin/azurin family copper-binding protein [Haloarculaceae archaeon]